MKTKSLELGTETSKSDSGLTVVLDGVESGRLSHRLPACLSLSDFQSEDLQRVCVRSKAKRKATRRGRDGWSDVMG